MPIEVIDAENGDYECIQDSASVMIESCDSLPTVDENDGYDGMSDKIRVLCEQQDRKRKEDSIPMVGVGSVLKLGVSESGISDFGIKVDASKGPSLGTKVGTKVGKMRKNITYRRFSLGHRHTVRNGTN